MKITVQKQEKELFRLTLPTVLLLNHISAAAFQIKLKKMGINTNVMRMYGLLNIVKEYRRDHPKWVIVEARTAGGEFVKIEL